MKWNARRMRHWLLPCLFVLAAPGLAAAPGLPGFELSGYFARGADTNLPEFPGELSRGELVMEDSWFAGLGFGWPRPAARWLATGLGWVGIDQPSAALEAVLVKHWGRQQVVELGGMYVLRTGFGRLGSLRARFGVGAGLSHAFGRPSYEDGPFDDPDRRYRTQNMEAYEVELGFDPWPAALVARIHHRSGAYGLIAPRNVGSNFMTAAVRIPF